MLRLAIAGPSRLAQSLQSSIRTQAPGIPSFTLSTRLNSSAYSALGAVTPVKRPEKRFIREKEIANEGIPFKTVQVVDPETNTLSPPTPLAQLLDAISSKRHKLSYVLVSKPGEDPVVKLLNLREEAARLKTLKTSASPSKKNRMLSETECKIVQVTWSTEAADLRHKVDQAKAELQKRQPVRIMLAPKRRVRLPPEPMRREMTHEIMELMKEQCSGETKVDRKGSVTTLFFRPLAAPQ